MTNQNLTYISLIVDKSGSMSGVSDSTISGINEFVEKQKESPGEAYVQQIQFDNKVEVSYDFTPIASVPPTTSESYKVRGATSLYDALGSTITSIGAKLAQMPEEERPGQVIVAILTDGYENSSREYTKQQIQDLIKQQTEVYSWQFLFLAANQDAVMSAQGIGIHGGNSMTYNSTSRGTKMAFSSISRSVSATRSARAAGASASDLAYGAISEDIRSDYEQNSK